MHAALTGIKVSFGPLVAVDDVSIAIRAGEIQAIVGDSPGIKQTLQRLERAARSGTATILVQGETGTGKELMAHYLHAHSARAEGPFVTLNCAAIPDHLLESELY